MRRTVAWSGAEPDVGMEFADIALGERGLSAAGVAVRSHAGQPYRVDYHLEAFDGFVTGELRVTVTGVGWRRRLDLRRQEPGGWRIKTTHEGEVDLPDPGGEVEELAGALDCDLALSPLTNTMPIRREGLLDGAGPVDLAMAWVSVPELTVHRSPQRYTPLGMRGGGMYGVRFSSLDSDFTAELTVDAQGLVVHYPGIASMYPEQCVTSSP